jgi:S-DNA-T family DNA segregation ATPase FtsK/SpoIIIE
MAKRKSTPKKKTPQNDPFQSIVALLQRPEVIGVGLVLISVLTLLSLLTSSTGTITGSWIAGLETLFGIGVWGFPLVSGALGLWLVIRAVENTGDMPWQQPLGCVLLFVAAIVGAALWTGPAGNAGGLVGAALAQGLTGVLGIGIAWAFVTFLAISGLAFLTDRVLVNMGYAIWGEIQQWRHEMGLRRSTQRGIDPAVPLPTGQIVWWRDLLDRIQQPTQNETISTAPSANNLPTTMVRAVPGPADQPARAERTRPTTAPATTPTQPALTPRLSPNAVTATEGELLKPRIVGNNDQEWRIPKLEEMLRNWERHSDSDDLIRQQGRMIQETLALFGVPADFEGAYKGPAVTQYLIKPGYVERTVQGEVKRLKVKVAKIAGLANDLALALAAPSVRIEAPIPGTTYVGVEVPNQEGNIVGLKELMESDIFQQSKGRLRIALGEDVKGQPIISDMTRMPHLLIAGATGTGKSVCINSIINCLLLTNTPDNLRLLMVDPKMVELSVYNGIPHLLSPVVTEVDKAAGVLFWAVKEMERRYSLCSKVGARDLVRYNEYLVKRGEKPLPYIVVVVDEMADLMMAAPEEVEKHICRLAQMARAIGIHLIIATQRPSVDVITGLIKANFPSRIAFAVTSQTDSRVILDVPGAERLLGRGDMLFMAPDASKLERLQGTFLNDEEINRIIRYWKGFRTLDDRSSTTLSSGLAAPTDDLDSHASGRSADRSSLFDDAGKSSLPATGLSQPPLLDLPILDQVKAMQAADGRDEFFEEAVRIVRETGRGSVSLLQRKLRIGYNRASRLVDQLEEAGVLGPDQGGAAGREVIGRELTDNEDEEAPSEPLQPRIIGGGDDEGGSSKPRVWM